MELLELLEKRIDALLAEIIKLRTDNSALQTELTSQKQKFDESFQTVETLKQENSALLEELNSSKQLLDESSQYIDTLRIEQENTKLVKERLEVLMQKIENVIEK